MSARFHLAYTRASVSTHRGASSVPVARDTQVALLPSGDMKINVRVKLKRLSTLLRPHAIEVNDTDPA